LKKKKKNRQIETFQKKKEKTMTTRGGGPLQPINVFRANSHGNMNGVNGAGASADAIDAQKRRASRANNRRQTLALPEGARRRTSMARRSTNNSNGARTPSARRQTLAGGSKRRETLASQRAKTPSKRCTSGAKLQKPSSSSSSSSSTQVRDPRQINDRHYMVKETKKVRAFLAARQYPVTKKTLVSPTKQDFLDILVFLLRQIDDNFRFTMAEPIHEVPDLFRQMNYPHSLNKSQLISVGSPHCWPYVLAALSWLVDVVSFDELGELYASGAAIEGAEDVHAHAAVAAAAAADEGERLFFDFLVSAYRDFLLGQDDFAALEQELASNFTARNAAERDAIAQLLTENEALREQIAALRQSALAELERKRALLEADRDKFDGYVRAMSAHNDKLAKELDAKQHAERVAKQDVGRLETEKERLHARIAEQEQQSVDVDRLHHEMRRAQDELDAVRKRRAALEASSADVEAKQSRKMAAAEQQIDAFNGLAREFHLVPQSAKHARGITYELRFNFGADDAAALLSAELKSQIRPGLKALRVGFQQRAAEHQRQVMALEDSHSQLREQLEDLFEEYNDCDARLRHLEQQYQSEKDALSSEIRHIQSQIGTMRADGQRLAELSNAKFAESQEQLVQLSERYQHVAQRIANEKAACHSALIATLDKLCAHKQWVAENIGAVADHLDSQLVEFQK
jgi:kinetochore protein NDC80